MLLAGLVSLLITIKFKYETFYLLLILLIVLIVFYFASLVAVRYITRLTEQSIEREEMELREKLELTKDTDTQDNLEQEEDKSLEEK